MFNFDIISLIQRFIVLFTAISFHEYAHGLVAYRLGDPTAKNMGRLTLNPMSHFDPLGALLMVVCGFGWAKPVPVNPYYFKEPKKDMALVAVAGPLANILLAFIFCTILPVYEIFMFKFSLQDNVVFSFIDSLILSCASLNISFAVFNLIPFPPLDGSKILFSVLPNEVYNKILTYERYGTIILLVASVTGILGQVLSYASTPIFNLFNIWCNFLLYKLGGLLL
jgi:Zn-dependent protease